MTAAKVQKQNESVALERPTQAEMDAEISKVALLPDLERDRRIGELAKLWVVGKTALKKSVDDARDPPKKSNGADGPGSIVFDDAEPWGYEVDGAGVADEVAEILKSHLIVTEHARVTMTLWAVHTWMIESFDYTGRIVFHSPTPRCGKSLALELLMSVCRRSLMAAHATTSVLFRLVEAHKPTLGLDEADTYFRDNHELRGLVNSGFHRSGFFLLNVPKGDGYEPAKFQTFAAMAIALIGKTHPTIHDRSFHIAMRRKLPSEKVERINRRDPAFKRIPRQLARWAKDHSGRIESHNPAMPAGLNDREADIWRPLFAIAAELAGDWPAKVEAAARGLCSASQDDSEASEVILLGDVADIFSSRAEKLAPSIASVIFSRELAEALAKIEDHPWAEYRNGKSISPAQLARKLSSFGVNSSSVRRGEATAKGYTLDQFDDAFLRYLPLRGLSKRHTVTTGGNPPEIEDLKTSQPKPCDALESGSNPHDSAGCDGVTLSETPETVSGPDCPSADPADPWHEERL